MDFASATAGESQIAHNLDRFKSILRSVLQSPRTKQVVEFIMAQAKALGPEVESWYTPGTLKN